MTHPVRIHFSAAFTDRPGEKRQIRSALEEADGPRSDFGPEVPTWIVIREEIEGTTTYVAHHTLTQFTLMSTTVDGLCQRVDTEMSDDTRYDEPSFRLDGRPDTRPDHGPDRSSGDSPTDR
jgi:hypothetical protein